MCYVTSMRERERERDGERNIRVTEMTLHLIAGM